MLILLLSACTGDDTERVLPGCGDGVVDPDEACDDGPANSTEPDACRPTCSLPACGDGVVDAGEACDDGANLGGDGCDPTCAEETGTLEVEPNEAWDSATPGVGTVYGSLDADDVDCFSFAVALCDAVTIREEAPCTRGLNLALHDPNGALLAVGAPDSDGCAVLDPADQPGARWVEEGTWAVCASAGAPVDGYRLSIATGSAAGLDAPVDNEDLDGDGAPDSCDTDTDGDGVLDEDDDCPAVSDGPDTPALALSEDGFVRSWLGAGPFTGGTSAGDCRPSDDIFVGEDAVIAPSLGDAAGSLTWLPWLLDTETFDLLNFASVDAPREAYALVYLHSDSARTLTLAVGVDDGVFAWWNGTLVMDISSCQGVNTDQFTASVDVLEGWNTLLFKVRDQGGGWGVEARFFDSGGGVVTDLEPSIAPGGSWVPGQSDADGDGLGDLCDADP